MAEKKELKPVIPVKNDPENLHISRDQFIEKRRKEKEKAARLAAYADKIDREDGADVAEAPSEEIVKKGPGRPKKSE